MNEGAALTARALLNQILSKDNLDCQVDCRIRVAMILLDPDPIVIDDDPFDAMAYAKELLQEVLT